MCLFIWPNLLMSNIKWHWVRYSQFFQSFSIPFVTRLSVPGIFSHMYPMIPSIAFCVVKVDLPFPLTSGKASWIRPVIYTNGYLLKWCVALTVSLPKPHLPLLLEMLRVPMNTHFTSVLPDPFIKGSFVPSWNKHRLGNTLRKELK